MWSLGRKFPSDGLFKLVIQHIALTDGYNETLVQQLRIVFFQFIDQDSEFFGMIGAICGDQKQQDGISLDVPQKTMSKTFSFCCAFYDPRQVGDTKGLAIAVFYHPQLRSKCRECIVGDLWLCCRYY